MADELEALEQLEKAELSEAGRARLAAIREELESKDPETWMEWTKRKVFGVMRWVVPAAALTAGAVGAAYVGKQAYDAMEPTVESAAHREVDERIAEITESFNELKNASGSLLLKMLDFMIALKDKASTYAGVSTLAIGVWDGLWAEGEDLIRNGDTSPDKLIAKMKEIVSADPLLTQKMDAIFASYDELKKKKEAFEESGKKAVSFTDKDAEELWVDYKREFWTEMMDKRNALSTSAPASESPKP